MGRLEDARDRYDNAGQGHVLQFYDSLNASEQDQLLSQLASIDPEAVGTAYAQALEVDKQATSGQGSEKIEPPPSEASGSLLGGGDQSRAWYERGLKAIGEGKVGLLLMAGGQGTRLGSSAPKGCYDIKLPSHKSLFQLQAERLRAVIKLGGGRVPWYIMTSGPTRAPTERFFAEHDYFGLDRKDVIFFEQGVLPCFDEASGGKFLLDSKGALAVAPDGNGGLYPALRKSLSSGSDKTVLSDLRERGVEVVHAYCVDNCLVRVADPYFVGYCLDRQADVGALVVRKTKPSESVGVLALRDGKFNILEYSELPKDLAEKQDKDGQLAFRAANIANHFYSLDFLERVHSFADRMPLHVARKKVPHVDLKSGERVSPDKPNGIKLEAFVCVSPLPAHPDAHSFDVFPFAERMAVLEDDRASVFSPLKNKAGIGADDEGTSRAALLAQQRRWIEAAGATVGDHEVELSPLVSLNGEGLESLKGKKASKSGHVESKDELATFFA